MAEDTKGASNNERLLAAARSDNEDLILEVFEEGGFDINCQDGLGNTRCDVDPINRLEKATPLHLAVHIEHIALRKHIVESLLDAGADTWIKDKNGETAMDILPPEEKEVRALIIKARATASMSNDDIADDDDDEPTGSGSESE
ncbi:hypothetical protein H0H93_004549 [Arthromyces matolae]|nr:hypothetical protein H0H93_004549 [Arthromyces matolae]